MNDENFTKSDLRFGIQFDGALLLGAILIVPAGVVRFLVLSFIRQQVVLRRRLTSIAGGGCKSYGCLLHLQREVS